MTVQVIGHRGARGLLPELSLAGICRALELNADGIELDVGVTRDSAVVVYHDRALNPDITRDPAGRWLAGTTPAICSLTLAELRQYDIGRIRPGSDYEREFPHQAPRDGSAIPTLQQVVSIHQKLNPEALLCIEAKHSPLHPQATLPLDRFVDAIVHELLRLDIAATSVVHSFDWNVIHKIREQIPAIKVWHLTSQLPVFNTLDESLNGLWTDGKLLTNFSGSIPEMVAAAGAKVWSCDYQSLNRQSVASAHQLGLKVYAWTANEIDDFKLLCDCGVDGIITDYPDRLISFLQTQA